MMKQNQNKNCAGRTKARYSLTAGLFVALVCISGNSSFAAAPPELTASVVSGAPTSGTVMTVSEARKKAKDDEAVLVQGRVREFVNGMATFSLLDPSIKSCTENGENCATPWDLCGDQYTPKQVSENSATVKVVGSGKAPIRADIKGVGGIDHLVPVVVEGTAKIDGEGNLSVRASKVYVKK